MQVFFPTNLAGVFPIFFLSYFLTMSTGMVA